MQMYTGAAGRIVEPARDNALYYYQRALKEDSEHAAALAGIQRVITYLLNTAEAAVFRNDWQVARRNAERIIAVKPHDVEALRILDRINRYEQLDTWAQAAIQQIFEGRLTKPKGTNALATYRQMLTLEPGNADATQ